MKTMPGTERAPSLHNMRVDGVRQKKTRFRRARKRRRDGTRGCEQWDARERRVRIANLAAYVDGGMKCAGARLPRESRAQLRCPTKDGKKGDSNGETIQRGALSKKKEAREKSFTLNPFSYEQSGGGRITGTTASKKRNARKQVRKKEP